MTQFTITTTRVINLSKNQINLIKALNKRSCYLHDKMADLADSTTGIADIGEGFYVVTATGKQILSELERRAQKS